MLDNARLIAAAVDLPVQADLENGFGDSPKIVAQTILEASATGIVGGSFEDATGRPADPAAEAAHALPFPFMLTARADQYLWGRADRPEVIQRAQAFETAGTNAIMVPGLSDRAALKSLCASVSLPVVVLIGAGPGGPPRERLAATGAKRFGVGGAMVRAALSAFVSTARDLIEGRELDGRPTQYLQQQASNAMRLVSSRSDRPMSPYV